MSPFVNQDHYAEHEDHANYEVNRSHISVFPFFGPL
jgi:hypothetical protein